MTIALGTEFNGTSVRTIISDALREGGILALGQVPDSLTESEGLRLLNRLFRSFLGNEMGDQLVTIPFGSNNVDNAYGKAEDRKDFIESTFIPCNAHLLVNLDSTETIYLDPNPKDGSRLAITDNSGNFNTYNLTVNGNGRKIEGDTEVVLNTENTNSEWFYRADLGEWRRVTSLDYPDLSPFPEQFDDLLTTMLAMRLNPRYGQEMSPTTSQMLMRARTQFRAKYSQSTEVHSELGIVRLPSLKKYFNYTVPLYRFYRGY